MMDEEQEQNWVKELKLYNATHFERVRKEKQRQRDFEDRNDIYLFLCCFVAPIILIIKDEYLYAFICVVLSILIFPNRSLY